MGVRLHLELEVEPGFDTEDDVEAVMAALENSQRDGSLVTLHFSQDALGSEDDSDEMPTYVKKVGLERTLD